MKALSARLLLLVLDSCASSRPPELTTASPVPPGSSTDDTGLVFVDTFEISSGAAAVELDAAITLPWLGPVVVHGATAAEIELHLAEACARADARCAPREMTATRPAVYYVLGAGTIDGLRELTGGLTVSEAIACAKPSSSGAAGHWYLYRYKPEALDTPVSTCIDPAGDLPLRAFDLLFFECEEMPPTPIDPGERAPDVPLRRIS